MLLNIEYIYCDTEYNSYILLCFCVVCMYGMHVFMYLHAHVCTSVHAHVFVQVRRHEVDFQCLPEFLYSSHFFFLCDAEDQTRS